MRKGRQRYSFVVRRGEDGGYALELESEPTLGLGGLGDLFQIHHLFVNETAKEVGEKVAQLLTEGEHTEDDSCSKDKA